MIKGYFNKTDLKVYVDYYFKENNLDVARQLGYFDFKNNWQKVSTNTELQSVFNDVTLESLNIEDLDYYKPPTLLPYAVEIPIEYRLPFRNGVFKLNAFEVPLDDYQNTKVVNLAYFEWAEFRAELDTKDANGNFVYQALKDSLMDLWDYVELQVINQNLIVL
jgi:hypothetical protein